MAFTGWREVPIAECGEPLVRLEPSTRIHIRSAYVELGYDAALEDVYLRAGVARRLHYASRLLPAGVSYVIWDGWRPVELQAELYGRYRADIAARTGLTGDALEQETQRFVSLPSTDPRKPSPHLTGGAVDLTLGDEHGNPLDLGGEFDELTRRSEPDFYEGAAAGTAEREFRDRRRLLRRSLESAGFTNYPEEWWHFDLHDQFWGRITGKAASYGPAAIGKSAGAAAAA